MPGRRVLEQAVRYITLKNKRPVVITIIWAIHVKPDGFPFVIEKNSEVTVRIPALWMHNRIFAVGYLLAVAGITSAE